jgi:alpha-galactosidase
MSDNGSDALETAPTRRSFITNALGAAVFSAAAPSPAQVTASSSQTRTPSFIDILRIPDNVRAFAGRSHPIPLTRSQSTWQTNGAEVAFDPGAKQMPIRISAPGHELTHVHLRWQTDVPSHLRCLGDHWERSYGDLAWRGLVPERAMPWYFATFDNSACHAYGVKTGAGALCFWQLDPEGVSLWLNLCNGGDGVRLGNRELPAAIVVSRRGSSGEDPLSCLRALCRQMCDNPRLPAGPVYGSNDWYYAYGKNSADQTLRDADLLAELSAGHAVRPFGVIDMGWENSPKFPDMTDLPAEIRRRNVRPGIWIRPLLAPPDAQRDLLVSNARFGSQKDRFAEQAFDPTIPDALNLAIARVRQVVDWGFELVKHDFSTYDLLGKWGNEMGAEPTSPGWSLHDRSLTNAEVIRNLYSAIREAAGKQTLILGCNTIGHLGAGIFELQRTGDDTSGENWERTRRMGVNTLAFRLPQHRTFFAQDADCVGITKSIPWDLNRQWLDLLARSGTALFISPAPDATGPEQRKAIAEAFAIAASGGTNVAPEDWLDSTTPERWKNPATPAEESRYRWCGSAGASPFPL